jgi:hypothetical protein
MPTDVCSNRPLILRHVDAADLKSGVIDGTLRHLFGAHMHQKCALCHAQSWADRRRGPFDPIRNSAHFSSSYLARNGDKSCRRREIEGASCPRHGMLGGCIDQYLSFVMTDWQRQL